MRTGKSSDSVGDLRWVVLKYLQWVGFELFSEVVVCHAIVAATAYVTQKRSLAWKSRKTHRNQGGEHP